MNQLALLLDIVEQARADFITEASGSTPEQSEFTPDPHSWSIRDITEHIVWAERAGVSGMWKAIDAIRNGKTLWSGANENHGLSIEQVVENTWQPKEKVPAIAEPKWGGPVEYWIASLKSCTYTLQALGAALEGMDPEKIIYPHPISGPLNVIQRLEFLRFHLQRHQLQIQKVKLHPQFP